jgi:hypothetical protein
MAADSKDSAAAAKLVGEAVQEVAVGEGEVEQEVEELEEPEEVVEVVVLEDVGCQLVVAV